MTSQSDICPSMLPYSGSVCKQELTSLSKCLPSKLLWNDVLIQSDQSEIVRPLLNALNAFGTLLKVGCILNTFRGV